MGEETSRIEELQAIQNEIIGIFCREECSLYEANLIIIWLSEQIDKLTQGRDPYESHFSRDKVESDNPDALEEDIVADSVQNIVNEILEDIGDILISKNLFKHECEMVLAALADKIC